MAGQSGLLCFLGVLVLGADLTAAQAAAPTSTSILKQPASCAGVTCDVDLSYTVDVTAQLVTFVLVSKLDLTGRWVAVGLSADQKMEETDIAMYTAFPFTDGSSKFTDRYATARSRPPVDTGTAEAKLVSATVASSVYTITFTKPCQATLRTVNRNAAGKNYFLWANGPVNMAGVYNSHGAAVNRGFTSSEIDISCPAPAATTVAATTAAPATSPSAAATIQPLSAVVLLVAMAFGRAMLQ